MNVIIIMVLSHTSVLQFRNLCKEDRNDVLLSLQELIYRLPLNSLCVKEYDILADTAEALVELIAELQYEPNGMW